LALDETDRDTNLAAQHHPTEPVADRAWDNNRSGEGHGLQFARERISVRARPEPDRGARQIGLGKYDPSRPRLTSIDDQLARSLQAGVQVEDGQLRRLPHNHDHRGIHGSPQAARSARLWAEAN